MSEPLLRFPPETAEQRLVAEVIFLFNMIVIFAIFGGVTAIDVIFTIIVTICCIVNLLIRFILVNEKGDWIFFLIGVVAGGGNDFMSMINGVYYYTAIPIIPNLALPIFMWLFWGQVFLLFRKIFNVPWFKGEEFKKDGILLNGWIDKKVILDIVLIIILRAVIYNTAQMDFWIPSLFYGIGVSIRLIIFPAKRNEWFIIIILPYAFMFEGLMVTFGLYVYFNPVFLGLPLWLMIWWIMLVPIVVKEIFDRIEFILEKNAS